MRGSRSSIPLFLVLASLLGLASCGGGGSSAPRTQSPQGTQGMNMEQMMAHCRQMQGMDHSQMGPDMQRMMQQCDAMMRSHGGGPASGGALP